ncbi:MAG: hypothetical protein V7K67_10255 [Nostoc sp.]
MSRFRSSYFNWQQRTQRPLPDTVKFALCNFERIWIADGSTLEALSVS